MIKLPRGSEPVPAIYSRSLGAEWLLLLLQLLTGLQRPWLSSESPGSTSPFPRLQKPGHGLCLTSAEGSKHAAKGGNGQGPCACCLADRCLLLAVGSQQDVEASRVSQGGPPVQMVRSSLHRRRVSQ